MASNDMSEPSMSAVADLADQNSTPPARAGTDSTASEDPSMALPPIAKRQRDILEFIKDTVATRGYPPSIREICAGVGLASPSTVHTHLNTLIKLGYLSKDKAKPRAIEIHADVNGAAFERHQIHHVPLVGDVAAGTGVLAQQNVEDLIPLPADLTGEGELFMLRVRGDSMIEAGIFDGDYVVARRQPLAENGDIVVAGIEDDEATVKRYRRFHNKIHLEPANPTMSTMVFQPWDVSVYGKVVTVIRKL
jgi:repressor LexA